MNGRFLTKLGHARQLVVVTVITTVETGSAVADGQLTAADIAALRERGKQEGWTFEVGENAATKRTLGELCGAVEPPDWRTKGHFDPGLLGKVTLPAAFDWRAYGGCTSIKNQGLCGTVGSCWAFGTVGPLECNIKIKDGVEVDLSEQWLISCNTNKWSCNHGGWPVHEYHQSTPGKCGHFGAVLETTYPYLHADSNCACTNALNHVYRIRSWAWIGGIRDTIPSVEAIKQAIMEHGPVSAAVYADSAFRAYNSGVFNACATGCVNHLVMLVGWDDNQGGGVWILRNSWGTDWGEAGYMRIVYNCSRIGYAACYVDYAGEPLHVTPASGFASEGLVGGPFDPPLATYTLTNRSESDNVLWVAQTSPTWLECSPPIGILPPGGVTNVTVSLNSAAGALAPGVYTNDWLAFTNLLTGHSQAYPVSLTVKRQPIAYFPLDTDPGWTREGEWAFGQPTGQGGTFSGNPDPTGGATGTNVFGVNLNGDYLTNSSFTFTPYHLTAGPFDFTGYRLTTLEFQRWLNTVGSSCGYTAVQLCTNDPGVGPWTDLWNNGTESIFDAAWTACRYDISALADNRTNVYVRWEYEVIVPGPPASGWNIDDIELLGVPLPVITHQPSGRTNDAGTTATFSVCAGCDRMPVSYCWVKNGTNYLSDGENISGTTTATLTITNALKADEGLYSVVVTNVLGSVTSGDASLTVNDPLITAQPANGTNFVGTTAIFSVSATGTAPLGYQWVRNGINCLADTNNVSGATGTTLTLTNVAPNDAGSYAVIVTNPAGTLASQSAILLVLAPPAITAQPQSRTNDYGTTATFVVGASGTEPLTYQWRKGGIDLPARTDAILTLANVGRHDAGNYAVLVTNLLGSTLSSNAWLAVPVPQLLGAPTVLADGTCVILSGDADGGLLSTDDLANFELYASTNLETWELLTNSLSVTDGQLHVCDPDSARLPQRFYRIIEH
jgi:hypothetical protein